MKTPTEAFKMIQSGQRDALMNQKITENFTWGEVVGKNPPFLLQKEATLKMLENCHHMAMYMERVRTYFGKPIIITSWLRVPTHNRNVGGMVKPPSWHMTGKAVDFRIAGLGILNKEQLARFRDFHDGGLGQSNRKGFIHIDLGKKRNVPYS